QGMKPGSVEVVVMIESALGVYRCYELITASPRVVTTCIGIARDGDLQTDLGCSWSIEGTELLYARSKVLLETRAAGKAWPLDGVFSDLGNEAGLIQDSQLSARLGYVGRTVIHPKQIAPVRRAYAVPEADVAYYKQVVSEFEAVEKTGTAAAITVNGRLVDYAMYQRAKRVLELAKLDR
ncbi:MAG TPA: aldolase/citrate lyase family protein, partial [Burkholderiales bacterium]|nr:aldolase/citrate lyase family protein [Burkholderiales bacterium]